MVFTIELIQTPIISLKSALYQPVLTQLTISDHALKWPETAEL